METTDKVDLTDTVGLTDKVGQADVAVGSSGRVGYIDCSSESVFDLTKEFRDLPGYSGSYARDCRLPHQVRFDRSKESKTLPRTTSSSNSSRPTTCPDDNLSQEIGLLDVNEQSSSESNLQEPLTRLDASNRYAVWSRIDKCPKCNGSEQSVFKYYDMSTDRYVVRCINVPRYVLNELDACCSGKQYKPPARTKNAGQIPLSHQVHSIAEYIDKVQPMLCSYHVSF